MRERRAGVWDRPTPPRSRHRQDPSGEAEAQRQVAGFAPLDDHGLPPAGMVRFHVLGASAGRWADVPEDAFWGREDHQLMSVIARVQDVITAISEV